MISCVPTQISYVHRRRHRSRDSWSSRTGFFSPCTTVFIGGQQPLIDILLLDNVDRAIPPGDQLANAGFRMGHGCKFQHCSIQKLYGRGRFYAHRIVGHSHGPVCGHEQQRRSAINKLVRYNNVTNTSGFWLPKHWDHNIYFLTGPPSLQYDMNMGVPRHVFTWTNTTGFDLHSTFSTTLPAANQSLFGQLPT